MSDDPVSPLFDYDITFSDDESGQPPTAHSLLRQLGVSKGASQEQRQEALDRWLAGGNEPSPFLARQLRRMGLQLPSQLLVMLREMAAAVETVVESVVSAGQPVPRYLGGDSAEIGDRYEISLAHDGYHALVEATREAEGWHVAVLDVDRGRVVIVDGIAVERQGLHVEIGDAISVVDYLTDTAVIDEF